jgi:predicted DNA-binding protein
MKKEDFNKTNTIQIRITNQDKKMLDFIKENLDITASDFLRTAIEQEYKFLVENKE